MSKKYTELTISRDCGYVMRGMAIMMIVLHNYCHIIPGSVGENEFSFNYSVIAAMMAPKATAMQWLYDIMSFFGWYGVPVFMFLTGYGLVMKYERDKVPLKTGPFLLHNYLKLFFLMLPAVIVMMVYMLCLSIPEGKCDGPGYLLQLSMLSDILLPWFPPVPGVFWYFGLTMEFYIIYALFIYRKSVWWMWAGVAVSIILQLIPDPSNETISWLRHNVTGWATPLVMGIVYGRSRGISREVAIIVSILSVVLILPSMLNAVTWQFSILACVVIAIVLAKWSMRIPGWRSIWIWIGRLSPMLFVAHPVAREFILDGLDPQSPALFPLLLYLCITFLLALVFRYFATVCCRRWLK